MKNPEEFRASVYARAQREKERLALRRQKIRNASLSAAMLLLVAALAVPLARTGPKPAERQVIHIPNQAAPVSVLLMSTASGETRGVVLDNQAQQKELMNKYKTAMNLGDDEDSSMVLAAEPAQAIRSNEELVAYLAGLLEAAGTVILDYDEAFFLENILYAMPMDMAAQPNADEDTTAARETSLPAQMTTIPDAPDAEPPTTGDGAETVTDEPASTEAPQTLPDGSLLQASDVKVLLLVPNKR